MTSTDVAFQCGNGALQDDITCTGLPMSSCATLSTLVICPKKCVCAVDGGSTSFPGLVSIPNGGGFIVSYNFTLPPVSDTNTYDRGNFYIDSVDLAGASGSSATPEPGTLHMIWAALVLAALWLRRGLKRRLFGASPEREGTDA